MAELTLAQVARRAAVATFAALAVFTGFALIVSLAEVWLLVFAGLLVAVLLRSSADAVARLSGRSHGMSLSLVILTITLAIGGAVGALWPAISQQADELTTRLPAAWSELRDTIDDRPLGEWLVGRVEPERVAYETDVVTQATSALTASVSAIGGVLIIVVVGIYVAAEPSLYRRGARRLLPRRGQQRFEAVMDEVGSALRWWLVGKFLSMTVVGVLTTAGLWLLGVPLALAFGLIAAALTFVPNIGPVLSVLPPALVALADEPRTAAYVVALYLGIQAVESYAITPIIQRRTVSVPPALTITAQLALGLLVGALAVAVATPLIAAVMTAVRVLYVEPHESAG